MLILALTKLLWLDLSEKCANTNFDKAAVVKSFREEFEYSVNCAYTNFDKAAVVRSFREEFEVLAILTVRKQILDICMF